MTDFAAIFDYAKAPKNLAGPCNLCGAPQANVSEKERDRYGYSVHVTRCPCGLVFLNPRMTKEAYAQFYQDGTYRRLVSAYHGREINQHTIQPEQLVYAAELAEFLGPYIGEAKTLLDVGGSTGVVAGYLAGRFDLQATVLDPSPAELAEAKGLETIQASVEDWDPEGRTWDVITLCQTVDHLLDIDGTLWKLRRAIKETDSYDTDGAFFVDFLDYDKTRTIKIDHPYNLTRSTMEAFLDQAGWEIAAEREMGQHRGYICTPAEGMATR